MVSGFVEDHGVEAVADKEAGTLIQLDRLVIGFRDGEGDCGKTGAGEVMDTVLEECDAEALAAIPAGDAELGDVGDVVGYTGTEKHSDQSAGAAIAEDPGGVGIEDAAAGEADNVVEEAQRAVKRAVLVVDARIDVSEVGLMDELGGGLVVVGRPANEFNLRRKVEGGQGPLQGGGWARKVVLHEETGIHGEAGSEEWLVDGAGSIEEEL